MKLRSVNQEVLCGENIWIEENNEDEHWSCMDAAFDLNCWEMILFAAF